MTWLLLFVLTWQSALFPALAAASVVQGTSNQASGTTLGTLDPTMVYDAGGQLKQSTDFRGYATSFQYDDRGRLLAKVPDSRLNEATLTYSFPDENTRTASRGNATTTRHLDPQRGWLSSVSGPNGTVAYSYNPEGQKVAMTSPSGVTGYGYDVLGRLSQISDQPSGATAATGIAAYAYDAVGNVASLTRGNGVQTRYAYDEQNRLSDLVNVDANNNQLSRFHYTLRADGKRTQLDESVLDAPDPTSGLTSSSVRSVAYAYDNAGKLTGENGQDGKGVAYANTWSYDAVGNRIGATCQKAATAGSTTWAHTTSVSSAFNANDQLTSSSSSVDGGTAVTQSYSYDQNGAEKTTSSASGTSTNAWNFEGKLSNTALADANGVASGGSANAFDAQGDRLSRVSNVGLNSQKTTSYLVDSDTSYSQVIEERAPDVSDAAGGAQLQARYVCGQGLAPLAMWRRMSDGSVKLFFHLSDGQESVRQLSDASGSVVDSYFYDAWGNALGGSSNNVANPFRYTGQQLDPDGRYYLRARFYNPGNGRFLSHDPLMGDDEDPISLHRYLYAGVDGIDSVDPSGLESLSETEMAQAIQNQLDAGIGKLQQVMQIYEKANQFVSAITRAQNLFNSFQDPANWADFVSHLTSAWSNQHYDKVFGKFNIDFSQLLDNFKDNMPYIAQYGVAKWAPAMAKSYVQGDPIDGMAFYLPNVIKLPQIRIKTGLKIPDPTGVLTDWPVTLILGGRPHLFGMAVHQKGGAPDFFRQLLRVDFGLLDLGHGFGSKGSGIQSPVPSWDGSSKDMNIGEEAVWEDFPFHYHVMGW